MINMIDRNAILDDFTSLELLEALNRRNVKKGNGLIQSKSTKKILSDLKENDSLPIGIALTYGYPEKMEKKTHICSRCEELKSYDNFSYYQSRIGEDGYLMRSHALCKNCAKESNKRRNTILKKEDDEGNIPPPPNTGDICTSCERKWFGLWHRHHDDVKEIFLGYVCGNCNMKLGEQRFTYNKNKT